MPPFRRFLENVRREFMQRLYVVILHGTLGYYLRDALYEGGETFACPLAPQT
jgi:hypothetical protein